MYMCVFVWMYAIYVPVAAEGIRFSRTLAIGSVGAQCGWWDMKGSSPKAAQAHTHWAISPTLDMFPCT